MRLSNPRTGADSQNSYRAAGNHLTAVQNSRYASCLLIIDQLGDRVYSEVQLVGEEIARIKITDEDLAPIDVEVTQVLSPTCPSTFRSLIAHNIREAIGGYRESFESSVSPSINFDSFIRF